MPTHPVPNNLKPTMINLQRTKPVTVSNQAGLTAAVLIAAQLLLSSVTPLQAEPLQAQTSKRVKHPNILFIIMDDVGIDQLNSFNPQAPKITPVLDQIAQQGVSFNNAWMMPECSPTRACFFTGRYPLRTGVRAAILSYNLPSTQVSPYEVTTPRVLANAGYTSALMGKYHLGGPDNNPAGYGAPAALGWNYYNGCLVGGPPYIDPTLGYQTTNTALYPCGFPVGPTKGVCWFQDAQTNAYCDDNNGAGYTGQECMQAGGIPALNANGDFATNISEATIIPVFTNNNGYYAWPRTINDGTNIIRTLSRKYMVQAQTDDSIAWIQQQRLSGKPWMCTASYSSIHTPYQQPPTTLYPPGFTWPTNIAEGNTNEAQIKIISDLMLYALDQEIGRLLVGAGLAQRLESGEIQYTPEATDTMVIIAGDNGTYYESVNSPYNPVRAKATPYQTGVQAPVIISGPMVRKPGRTVSAMINAVDFFELFGEIAGLNVRKVVPSSHILDCVPTLGYLTNPGKRSSRTYNYSELGSGKPPLAQTWPSVFTIAGAKLGNDILFDNQQVCEESGGEWFGPGAAMVYSNCCDVRAYVYTNLTIQPTAVWTVRNDRYKLVKSQLASCDSDLNPYEFYDLKPTTINPIGLDNSPFDLLKKDQLTITEQRNLIKLTAVMDGILDSEPACPGDGNLDKEVNEQDIQGVIDYWGLPSVFDFNNDGVTDLTDLQTVQDNFGDQCFRRRPVR